MHGVIEAGLLSLSRRELRQNMATRIRITRSALVSYLVFLAISSASFSTDSRPQARTCCTHMPRHKTESGLQARAVDWRIICDEGLSQGESL
jgi:hypothetical protein